MYGLEAKLGEFSEIEEWVMEYLDIFPPVFPEQFDASRYEKIGDGLYQALEEASSEEAERLFASVSNPYYTFTVESLQIQVKDERIESISVVYARRRGINTYYYTEIYSFEDFVSVTVQMPEPTEDPAQPVNSGKIMTRYLAGEGLEGKKGLFQGDIVGTMDHCLILSDFFGVIPLYIDGGTITPPSIWNEVELNGTIQTDRFRGAPSVSVDDPEKMEIESKTVGSIYTYGDEVTSVTNSALDVVNFTCLRIPAIPDEETLAKSDYTVPVSDSYGNHVSLYLGDADTAEQNPTGSAAKFRAKLREFVGQQLAASGKTECEVDLKNLMLIDHSVFVPVRETQFSKSDGPNISISPKECIVKKNPGTTLAQALGDATLIHKTGQNSQETERLAELAYSCPEFDPNVPGTYSVTVTYKGFELTFTIRVIGEEQGIYMDEMHAETLADLVPDRYPGASLPAEGDVNILVIPIRFTDSTEYGVDLVKAFNSDNHSTGWYSLYEYYKEVSFDKLHLHADIMEPFETNMSTKEVRYQKDARKVGAKALAYYDDVIDYTKYDKNGDGQIDCVYLVYDVPLGNSLTPWWSMSGFATKEKFDGMEFYQYIWISAETFTLNFWTMKRNDDDGIPVNCRTLIHETGHALGLADYYGYTCNPSGDTVMMCSTLGDHDPLSKMLLGWTDPSFDFLKPQTLTLDSYTKTGHVLMISPDEAVDYFKDYYLVILYEPEGVNKAFAERDKDMGAFHIPGIAVYRVQAEMSDIPSSPIRYFSHNNESGLDDALIRLIQNGRDTLGGDPLAVAGDEDLFQKGDSYTFAWEDSPRAPPMTMIVGEIYEDGDGLHAKIELKW